MKVGFGSKGKKHKQKKGKKKGKQGKGDGDERMADVQHPGTPVKVADMEMNMQQPTAKDKQRQRMQLKRALKVTVAGLKSKRCAGLLGHYTPLTAVHLEQLVAMHAFRVGPILVIEASRAV
jgi:hypothetical protein